MDTIRRRTYKNRSSNAVWHVDSTHKLFKYKCIASSSAGRCSWHVMWLKCYNNNKGIAAHELCKEVITNYSIPLQVHGRKG